MLMSAEIRHNIYSVVGVNFL